MSEENEITLEQCDEMIKTNITDWRLKMKIIELLLSLIESKENQDRTKKFVIDNSNYLINEIYDLRSGYVNIVCSLLNKIFEGQLGSGNEFNIVAKAFLSSEKLIKGLASGNSVIQLLTHECFKMFFEKCEFVEIPEIKEFYEKNKSHKNAQVRENVVIGFLILMRRVVKGIKFNIKIEDIKIFLSSKDFFIKDKNEEVRKCASSMEELFEQFEESVFILSDDKIADKNIETKSLFDVLNCKKMNIKNKKAFFLKFDSKHFYKKSKFEDLERIIRILQVNKNFEVKNFLTKILNDFPLNNILIEVLNFLEKNDLSKNFLFNKFIQRVFKGSLLDFIMFHEQANTPNSLGMLLKRFTIKGFKLISTKNQALCTSLLNISFDNISKNSIQSEVKKNFELIDKLSDDEFIKEKIQSEFSNNEFILIIERNSALFKKIFIDQKKDADRKTKENSGEEKTSNNSTNLEDENSFFKKKNANYPNIFSEKIIENYDTDILPNSEPKESKMDVILSSEPNDDYYSTNVKFSMSETTIDI